MADQQQFPGLNSYHTDVIEEILVHVPVVDLLRCKQVCKLWHRLISSQEFLRKQVERASPNIFQVEPCNIIDPREEESVVQVVEHPPPHGRMMLNDDRGAGAGAGAIPWSVARWWQHLHGEIQWEKHIKGEVQILGSCDGLICLRIRYDKNGVVLYNPATHKSRYVRIGFPTGISFSWFGSHGYGYTLVTGYDFNGYIGVQYRSSVYTPLRTRPKITFLEVSSCGLYDRIGTLVNQTLYWPSTSGIVAYDLREKELFQIPGPAPLALWRTRFTLGVVDACLCAFILKQDDGPSLEMWMMRGESSSWSKCRKIEGRGDLCPIGYARSFMVVLRKYTLEDEEGHGIITRRLDTPKVVILHCCIDYRSVVFVKTLVSPQVYA